MAGRARRAGKPGKPGKANGADATGGAEVEGIASRAREGAHASAGNTIRRARGARSRVVGRGVAAALGAVAAVALAATSWAVDGIPRTPAPEGARVYIISPADGAEVKSPVTVRFGLSGMGVAPAGTQKASTGHHHLIIDAPLPSEAAPIPKDDNHRHFGGGQTEAVIDLPPGRHTLQLLVGDHLHVPHDPPIHSEVVTITVVK